MATTILIIAAFIEIAFVLFCIYSKSLNRNIRSILRVGAFTVFVISVLTTVIDWNFRWQGLAALLLVWAVLGCINLITAYLPRKNPVDEERVIKASSAVGGRIPKTQYTFGRVIRKAVVALLLVSIALIPALVFPDYQPIETTGEYKVATKIDTYADQSRIETYTDRGEARKLTVEFWYPENKEEHSSPLVVFSHGSFGMKTSNESLFRELASHGYVVCSIDHTYQCIYTSDTQGNKAWMDMGYVQDISAEDAHSDRQQSYEYYQKWMAIRTGDINFVIDHLLGETARKDADTIYKLIDTAKIGVMGHSLGGSAALGIGRMRDDISAVIALESPFMCDIEGVKDGEFIFTDKVYPVPVLNIYSDSSWDHLSEWAQYAGNNALLSETGATAFNIHIGGAGHLSLTDLALASPFLARVNGQKPTVDAEECLKTLNKDCLEFFDRYLVGEGKFTSGGANPILTITPAIANIASIGPGLKRCIA